MPIASRSERFSAPPLPAQEGDGNPWLVGECWRCDTTDVLVLWIGPAETHGAAAPFYACGPCIQRLTDRIHAYNGARDTRAS